MTRDVLIEVGVEELPARFVDSAEKQLLDQTSTWLKEERIPFNDIQSYSTPRRFAVLIKDIAEEQTSIEEEVKGPALKIAKDEEGNWTKAAIGFTKGQGKSVDDIYTRELKGTTYIYVKKQIEGKPTKEILSGIKHIIESIQFGKNMRWSTETLKYARPIRWLVALYDEDIVPFEIASVKTGNKTFGHRFLGKEIILTKAEDYPKVLKEEYVIVNAIEREEMILNQIKQLETENDIIIPVDDGLLDEVRNLVEYPTVFMGSFEDKYLDLPSEVLITSMKEHQRYFPVKTKNGKLLSKFVGVRNGNDYEISTVVRGNEKVLRARLSDAEFFYEEDQKHSIDFYQEKLSRVIFQDKLGTYTDKVNRVVKITKELTSLLNLDETLTNKALRAAEISKFDLMTNMVNEFTELQGIIGEKYANNFAEDKEIAISIREHYLPKQANGSLPETIIGSIVSVADKLDTIVGCISVGLVPTGSQDPYGLRRQATGILRILDSKAWNISLEQLLGIAKGVYYSTNIEMKDKEDISTKLHDFFKQRANYLLKEINIEQDIIHAVLDQKVGVFPFTKEKAKLLSNKRNDENFKTVQEAFVRVLHLADKAENDQIDETLFKTESEKKLFEELNHLEGDFRHAMQERNAKSALDILSELAKPIHAFFDNNMVMADDKEVRDNRLALVVNIAILISEYATLSLVEWKQHN